jgi:hypothetical protein
VSRDLDGLTTTQTVGITVTLSAGYQVGDADAAIVWLAQEAWSAGSRRPSVMSFSFEDSSGKPLEWGWKDALTKRGWDVSGAADVLAEGNLIILARSAMISLTGESWPGPVPETPANLFVKN